MDEYTELTERAIKQAQATGRAVDLVVWPETMYRNSLVTVEEGAKLPEEAGTSLEAWTSYAPRDLAARAKYLNSAMLVGLDRRHVLAGEAEMPADADVPFAMPPMEAYNSSILIDPSGTQKGTYDKVHRVMFGEYVPLVDWIPFFDRIEGLTGGIEAGGGPTAMELNGVRYSPNICYETVIPHVIRRHFVQLADRDERPDVLVNLTNDAWYWGSSELDMHLACGVFRAIECRTPLVIAANGGISASIDSSGRILAESPRSQTDVLIADVKLDPRDSLYVEQGDLLAGGCLIFCLVLVVVGFARRKSAKPDIKE